MTKDKTTIISLLIICLSIIIYSLINIHNTVYWYDESYSVSIIQHSFYEISKITAIDVHPPLYYFMLKIFGNITGNTMIGYRFFSTLGIFCLFLLGLFPIKKRFGGQVSLLYIILIALFPFVQYLASDIRMYSWAVFFVTWTSLNAYAVYIDGKTRNYILLLISLICSAYTHYYALIAALIIYMLLFCIMVINKKKIILLLSVFIVFIGIYSFWITNLIHQIKTVNEHFWINPLTAKDLLLFIYYTFCPKDPSHPYTIFNMQTMSAALLIMLYLFIISAIFIIKIANKKTKTRKNVITGALFASIFFIILILTVGYSYLKSPVVIPRYVAITFGTLIIGLSIMFSEVYNNSKNGKFIIYTIVSVLLLLSIGRFFSERKYIDSQVEQKNEIDAFIQKHKSGKTVFMCTYHSSATLSMFEVNYPNNIFLVYNPKRTKLISKPFNLIEVSKLPSHFDLFFIKNNTDSTTYKFSAQDIIFLNNIQNDISIEDSLSQEKITIYRMRTKHRSR